MPFKKLTREELQAHQAELEREWKSEALARARQRLIDLRRQQLLAWTPDYVSSFKRLQLFLDLVSGATQLHGFVIENGYEDEGPQIRELRAGEEGHSYHYDDYAGLEFKP